MAPPDVVFAEPQRFDLTESADEAMQYLNEHGYVVLANVLDAAQVLRARELLWDWLENESGQPISRTDPSTWHSWPKWRDTGVIPINGIGHSELLWFVRSVPAVREAFERVWHTDDLIVSFDGAGAFRPWQIDASWKSKGGWYHVDQNGLILPKQECVQGLVSLFDQTETSGGLVVVPDSQRIFHDVTDRHARSTKGHLVRLLNGWDDELLTGYQPILVGCKAGDLVLWDSRTIHCNTPGLATPPLPAEGERPDLLRAVAYVCMVPREKADAKALSSRAAAVAGRITTSHWPQFYFPNHAALPGTGPRLTAEQRTLI